MPDPLVDIGVHLTNRAFRYDLDEVVARARSAGVHRMVVSAISIPASRAAVELARQNPGVLFATAGIHPHNARSCTSHTLADLRRLATSPSVVAIGACGLDFVREHSPRQMQLEWFERQVELAVELQKPLLLHERGAREPFWEILARHRVGLPAAVVRCFAGDRAALDAYRQLDLHLGIGGAITDERRNERLDGVIASIPADRLMVESAAPFLLPRCVRPKPRGGRNEPALLPHVVDAVAGCRGSTAADVARTTTRTAELFFDLCAAAAPRRATG